MKLIILHGPNLNLLGSREPNTYGNESLELINERLKAFAVQHGIDLEFFQSNSETALVEKLQHSQDWASGVVFNPGAFTHTSIALRDAISSLSIPVVEVHLSNVYSRETFRHNSMLAPVCIGQITGFGWRSYWLGIQAINARQSELD